MEVANTDLAAAVAAAASYELLIASSDSWSIISVKNALSVVHFIASLSIAGGTHGRCGRDDGVVVKSVVPSVCISIASVGTLNVAAPACPVLVANVLSSVADRI